MSVCAKHNFVTDLEHVFDLVRQVRKRRVEHSDRVLYLVSVQRCPGKMKLKIWRQNVAKAVQLLAIYELHVAQNDIAVVPCGLTLCRP